MNNTSAKKELENWLEEHHELERPRERAAFLKMVQAKLEEKGSGNLDENFFALKDYISEMKARVKSMGEVAHIQVTPATEEESALLRSIFDKMNIAYKEVKVA